MGLVLPQDTGRKVLSTSNRNAGGNPESIRRSTVHARFERAILDRGNGNDG